jgi:uncharacterized protein
MKKATMSRTLQLGDTQVDGDRLQISTGEYQVRELSFLGSAARDEMRPDAEIDLVDYARLMLELSHLLERRVDLVSKNGLKPPIRTSILQEARLLYAA